MRSLKFALFALVLVAVASAADNASNFTCVGNPYFTAPYNPNAVNMTPANATQLKNWNVTFDNNTNIYNFSNLTNLELCKGLIKTGSCCNPDILRQNARDFEKLMNMSNNATMKVFQKRANTLRDFGKVYGKIISNQIRLISKIHSAGFKAALNIGKLVTDQDTMLKVLAVAAAANASDAFTKGTTGDFGDLMKLPTDQLFNLTYQMVSIVAPVIGVSQNDVAEIFGGIKTLMQVAYSLPTGLLNNFDLFPTVDKGIMSDAMDSLNRIVKDIGNRMVNVTLRLDGSSPSPKSKRFLAADAPVAGDSSLVFNVSFPIILDARNIESIFRAILIVVGNGQNATSNSTEMFNRILKGNNTIYAEINRTLISNMTELRDFKAGGEWPNTQAFFINLFKGPFDESVKKIANVAENKKKCMQIVFQYQGYVGCLACDPSAVSLGKIKLGTDGTFGPVLSSAFGNYIQGNCSDYFKDLIFVKNFMTTTKVLMAFDDVNQKAQKDPKNVDLDPKGLANVTVNQNDLDFGGSLNDPKDTWIRSNIFDQWGPTIGLLCDYSPQDCDLLDAIKGQRNPFFNKTQPSKKRLLADNTTTSSVTYSDNTTDEVSTTSVGFNTTSNYTVDTSQTTNITADTSSNSSNSTNTSNTTSNTSNSTNASNGSNSSNGTNGTKFGLKSLVSIPLIVATIFAFLLQS